MENTVEQPIPIRRSKEDIQRFDFSLAAKW